MTDPKGPEPTLSGMALALLSVLLVGVSLGGVLLAFVLGAVPQ